MAITAASIDATGYYLSLTGTWTKSAGSGAAGTASAYPFSDYSLTPDTAPKVKLNVARPGYIRSGGQASAATRAKVIPAALMMRGPVQYDPPSSVFTLPTYNAAFIPNNIPLDEVDNGTTRTVRILLHQRAYASEACTLDVLAGWRTGETSTSAFAVTNNSTATHPLPVLRPATAGLKLVTGAFRWDDAMVAHYPEGFDAVCAIKYWVTDGTNNTTGAVAVWVIGATVSPLHGDNLKCWGATLDPGLAGLVAGPIMVNRTVYPWTGAARNHATTTPDTTLAFSTVCERGEPMIYDPAQTRWVPAFVEIDAVNGTITAAAGMVFSSVSGAKGLAATSKPKDYSTAIAACRLARAAVDGMTIMLQAGQTVTVGATAVSTGLTNAETWVNIVGDPTLDPAVARVQCRLNAGTVAPPILRVAKFRFANLTIGANSQIVASCTAAATGAWLDNVTVDSLNSAATTFPITNTGAIGFARMIVTNVKFAGHGKGLSGAQAGYSILVRNFQSDRGVSTMTMVGFTRLAGQATDMPIVAYPGATDPDALSDVIRFNIDARGVTGVVGQNPYGLPVYTGAAPNTMTRCMNVNVVVEVQGGASSSLISAMDSAPLRVTRDNLWENCTFLGDRTNGPYDEPVIDTSGITGSISGSVMTVTATASQTGGGITVGATVYGASAAVLGVVASGGTGTGQNGTYNLTGAVAGTPTSSGRLDQVAVQTQIAEGNVYRNYVSDRPASKSDAYNAIGALQARGSLSGGSQSGYAKARTRSQPFLMGADHFASIDLERFPNGTTAGAVKEGYGLYGKINPTPAYGGAGDLTYPKFTADKSVYGTGAGFGDYRPGAGSPLLASPIADANTDRDLNGATRGASFAAGALEAMASFALLVNSATLALAATAPTAAVAYAVTAYPATASLSAGSPPTSVAYPVYPPVSTLALKADLGAAVPVYSLTPPPSALAMTAGAPAVATAYGIAGNAWTVSLAAGSPAVTTAYGVTPAATVTSLAAGFGAVAPNYVVAPAGVAQSLAAGSPLISFAMSGSIAPSNASLTLAAGIGNVSVIYAVSPAATLVSLASGAGGVSAAYGVAPNAASVGLSAGAGAIGAGNAVFPSASTIGLTAIAGAVVPAYTLTPDNASPALTTGIGGLSVSYSIAPNASFVSLSSGAGAVTTALFILGSPATITLSYASGLIGGPVWTIVAPSTAATWTVVSTPIGTIG